MNPAHPTPTALRHAYNDQIRTRMVVHDPKTETVEQSGPLWRKLSRAGTGLIAYRDLDGFDGPDLDALIAAQRDRFARQGGAVEWKYHDYDRPADLPQRLSSAGFVPGEPEALVLGEAADVAIANRLPAGVTLRRITGREDLERLRDLQNIVWGTDHDWLPDALTAELGSDTDPIIVVVAEADGDLVCGSWIRFHKGTDFASLWGGSTLPQWRGRGIYRAAVARRAQFALAQGFRYLQVDSSPNSRPILESLGLSTVAMTTP
ncbi:MAG: GNAT family N-acetyltransferase [Stackebrandtia sp.]